MQLAVLSLIDGALQEGVSARVLARLAPRCEDPAVRAVVAQLAADEGRHAAHGWDVALWCLQEGGEPVAQALSGATRALPESLPSGVPDFARDGTWEARGVPGTALEDEANAKARAHLIKQVEAAVRAAPMAA